MLVLAKQIITCYVQVFFSFKTCYPYFYCLGTKLISIFNFIELEIEHSTFLGVVAVLRTYSEYPAQNGAARATLQESTPNWEAFPEQIAAVGGMIPHVPSG